ncbi:AMP-binding protein, partial [Thermodesulfobacteriota bacterium]
MNVGIHLKRSAKQFSDRIALDYGKHHFTYRQFNERVNRLANGLIDLGLKKGDRVALLSPNCHQLVEGQYACLKAGIVRVPLNARLSTPEIIQVLNDSESSALIMGPEYIEDINHSSNEISTVKHYIGFSSTTGSVIDYEGLVASSSAEEPAVDIELGDMATLNYTSGTSGVLKAAILTQENLISQARRHCLITGIDLCRSSIMCHVAPVTHASGGFILPVFWRGGCNLILSKFDPKLFLQTIERSRVTHLLLVPTMLDVLMAYPELKKFDFSSLQTILLVGSPPPSDLIRRTLSTFGPILIQGYGQTETCGGLIFLDKEDHFETGDAKKIKHHFPTGLPSIDYEVRVVNEEGDDVKPDEVGEIISRGDGSMLGYWKASDLTAKTLRDGWVYSGDMATVDEYGYIYIVDRVSDMIKSGGLKIYPSEVEKILSNHPSVSEAAVVGVPDERWGESVKAVVILREKMSATEEEIITYCKQNLASY